MISDNLSVSDFEVELIRKIASGDDKAFKKLYDRYRSKIYSLAVSILKNTEDSEDIVVEVFTSIWNNRVSLPEVSNLDAFVYTVTKNKSLNLFKKRHIRHKNKQQLVEENFFEHIVEASETTLYFKETQNIIISLVSKLPHQQKQVFDLAKLQGYKRKEIAKELNLSENTVRNHLNAAIKALKKDFETRYPHLFSILLWIILK